MPSLSACARTPAITSRSTSPCGYRSPPSQCRLRARASSRGPLRPHDGGNHEPSPSIAGPWSPARDTWSRVDARIAALLDATWLDRNVVFYLRHRYPPNRALFARIVAAYHRFAADEARSWISWYERSRPAIKVAQAIQRGERSALPARYQLFAEARRIKPIVAICQGASWSARASRTCVVDLTLADLDRDFGIDATWRRDRHGAFLALRNAGRRASAALQVSSAVSSQCRGTYDELIIDWALEQVDGAPATHFYVRPLPDKQRFHDDSAQVRVPLLSGPVTLLIPLARGQRYRLRMSVTAVALAP